MNCAKDFGEAEHFFIIGALVTCGRPGGDRLDLLILLRDRWVDAEFKISTLTAMALAAFMLNV